MSTLVSVPGTEQGTAPVVRACYDLLTVVRACGISDLTDGKYVDDRNDRAAYLAAQQRQVEYLLDQVYCRPGVRLLDIGCGYGRVLERATQRGANSIGITISPPQVAACRAQRLDVRELNYRNVFIPGAKQAFLDAGASQSAAPGLDLADWEHAFDAIVANGSIEHFVQVNDAAAGNASQIYGEFFTICRRLLVDGGRLVTTAIHFRRPSQFDPARIVRGRRAFHRGSDEYQFAMLVDMFGGWYPEPGQLEQCARPFFSLVAAEDGTHDYHLTSEYWLRQLKRSLAYSPRFWLAVAKQFYLSPRAAREMMRLQLIDQAWAWQFRPPAPMQLWRHTWAAR